MSSSEVPGAPRPEPEPVTTSTSEGALPLRGVRVLDLTTFLAGPYCTQILGDLGAEVIKVEPTSGDSSRSIPPHFVGSDSAYFLAHNRNKSSIVIDLKKAAGQQLVRDLVAQCDVVIENYRPGVCERLGLDPVELRARHPRLIWASISGFGQEGTRRDRPAYDMIVQALSGVMSLTGEPGRPSVRLGIPAGDVIAGMFAVIGVLAALPDQREHGRGRTLDISMLDGQLAMLSYQATYALLTGLAPEPQGSRHDSIPTYRSVVSRDGRQIVITANTERMWRALCKTVGAPELLEDPRFVDASHRLEHRAELDAILEARFREQDADHWVTALTQADVPVAPIRNVTEALDDARHAGRDMVVDLRSPDGHTVPVVGNPVRYTDAPSSPASYPPALGEHTDEILQKVLGRSAAEVATLREAGAVV